MNPQPLHLWLPFDLADIDNGFGPAAGAVEAYYKQIGLLGHPGLDFMVPWGTPIPNCMPGAFVSAILSKDNPNLMAFRAVNTILDLPGISYELQYGHVSEIDATVGQVLQVGDTVAKVGNTGDVFVGGAEVTAAQKGSQDPKTAHLGAHLHFQLRVLTKVPEAVSLAKKGVVHRLNDGSGDLVHQGFVYEVPNWDNGYNGCVDPRPFLNGILARIQGQVTKLQAQVQTFPAKPTQSDLQALIAAVEAFLGWSS